MTGTVCTKPRLNSPPKNRPFRAVVQKPPPTSPQGTSFRADFPEKQPQNALPVEKTVHNPPNLPVQLLLPPVQFRPHPVHFPTCPRAILSFPPLPLFPFSFTFIPAFFGKFMSKLQIFPTFLHHDPSSHISPYRYTKIYDCPGPLRRSPGRCATILLTRPRKETFHARHLRLSPSPDHRLPL